MGLFAGTKWDIPPTCDSCGLEQGKCDCPPKPEPAAEPLSEIPPEKQRLRIQKEKRKKGKIVTTISGFSFANSSTGQDLLKQLKDLCGTGGKIQDEVLELQGDLTERLEKELLGRGYKVRVIR